MSKISKPEARQTDIVRKEVAYETLIYDLAANRALCLNETSALVWELSNGKNSTSKISDEMSKRLNMFVSEEFVLLALDQLQKNGLLEHGWNTDFSSPSRRQILKMIGSASAAALPLVSLVAVPGRVSAQSCIATGDMGCGANDAACCQNNCTGTGGTICCAPGITHATPLTSGQVFCEAAASCATSITAALRCCSTGTASPVGGMCPSPGQIACACD